MDIALGIVSNSAGAVLLAQRATTAHQGGLWEFPGGKQAIGESIHQTLHRELQEELGIKTIAQRPLIQIRHHYADRTVFLHVLQVTQWQGKPIGCEGQPTRWVQPSKLKNYPMPAANQPIIHAIQLPDRYVITPPTVRDPQQFLHELDSVLDQGTRLLQFRIFGLTPAVYHDLVHATADRCRTTGTQLMLNTHVNVAQKLKVSGLHLNSQQLWTYTTRPTKLRWLAASCHNLADLQQAQRIGADFAVLSPILPTWSHPNIRPLGWQQFTDWATAQTMPVYALGGMTMEQLPQAWQAGAQGVAGIRGLWV